MNQVYDKLMDCYMSIKDKIELKPEIALVLGSGLGGFVQEIEVVQEISYQEIEGFPISTVPGHQGKYIFGKVKGVPVVVMQGRVHYYEGYDMTDVVLPIRLMGLLGAKTIMLTNAAGGVNTNFHAGDFMMITDHISCFVPSPLIGKNIDELGTRFPDMSEIYHKELQEQIKKTAENMNIPLQEGVYMQLTGPNFESPSEVKMCRTLGADAVGMSTAVEAMVAKHMGLKVCGISCISNMACGITNQPLTHEEVQETADRVAMQFQTLVKQIIFEIGRAHV